MTSQGFLRADGHFARAGIYEYRRADGSLQRELRPIEEVQHADSLASYDAAPVTIGHPSDEVTASNVRTHEVGTVMGAARADGDHVAGEVAIKDAKAIKLVQDGLQELSPGYRIRLEEKPGADPRYGYPGNEAGRWDSVQRDIRVNHVAIVPRARGGSTIRLRMDSAEQVEDFRYDAALSAKERHALSDADFAVPDGEGLPISDDKHVRAAMSRFGEFKFKDSAQKKAAYGRIVRKAKKLGVDASGFTDKWGGRLDGTAKLTTIVDGHQHSVDLEPCYGSRMSGCTSWAVSANEKTENGHSHDWVRNPDGTITISMSEGHTHSLPDDSIMATLNPGPRYDSVFDQTRPRIEGHHMDKDELIRSLRQQLADAEAKLGPLTERAAQGVARADSAEATIHTLRGEITELRSQIASAATVVETEAIRAQMRRADEAEAELRRREDAVRPMIEARVTLERRAAVVMPELNMRGMNEREIWSTIVKRLDANADISASMSDAYLQGKFDSLLDQYARTARSHRAIGDVIIQNQQNREDQHEAELEKKRKEYRNQGLAPLPNSRRA